MKQSTKLLAPLLAALAAAACGGNSINPAATSARLPAQTSIVPNRIAQHRARRVCPNEGPLYGECMSLLETGSIEPNVSGWTPLDLRTRYRLPSERGAGQVVAIVDAFDNPNVASDLGKYRRYFGLGKAKFTKFNQRGQPRNYPRANARWGVEIDLDVEMVSAVCPKCTIDLIEADNNLITNLDKAEAAAVKLGAHIVSNSWGCPANDCVDPSVYEAPRVLYLASAGDSGFGTQSPAALGNVVSVGGTVLSKAGDTYDETTWDGTGSGCAKGVKKPAWQHDAGCAYRSMNDVSAVALDVAEYDSFRFPGWFLVGGTSISTPLIAGVFALAGNAGSQHAAKRFWTMSPRLRARALHDITTGSDTTYARCGGYYLCAARRGYDGPTGWGTPNGIGAF